MTSCAVAFSSDRDNNGLTWECQNYCIDEPTGRAKLLEPIGGPRDDVTGGDFIVNKGCQA